jgi:opacity protein-like surface antigen
MKKIIFSTMVLVGCLIATNLFGQKTIPLEKFSKWYVKPYAGFIGIQDMSLTLMENNQTTNISIETGFGFTSGVSLGYHFTKNLSTEIGWEYKRNEVTITTMDVKSKGDYASNIFYVNGIYNFITIGKLKPYAGLGACFIQEIDLDFGFGENESFSNSGNLGFQAVAGLDFNLSERWALNWEAKYTTFSKYDMENESNGSSLINLKYNPFIFNIGVKYRF